MYKIGWLCSYTPVELIDAAGALPLGIRSDSKAEHEDVLLGDSICSYVRSCMGGALTGVYDALDAVVIAHSCECMRRLADGWMFRQKEIKPELVHILDVPKIVTESSIHFFANGLKRLTADLEKRFGEIPEAAIRHSMDKYNQTRALFGKITEMRKGEAPPVTGLEMEQLVFEFFRTPAEQFNRRVRAFIDARQGESGDKGLPRIMLLGGPGNPSLVQTIEKAGGLCVVENMCTGMRSHAAGAAEAEDPFVALSQMYLSKTACPRMLGSKAREAISEIQDLVRQYRVDGVVFYSMKFCASMQMQWAHLKNDVDMQVPMKVIEGDISSEINEREIHSFIKRLKKRRKRKK